MAGFAPPALVEGPTRTPAPYGLFSVVDLNDPNGVRWENGVKWESVTCDDVGVLGGVVCGTDEQQKVSITGAPTGGTFTLTFDGSTTAAVAYNATAADVAAALNALPSVKAAGVAASGGPLPATAVTVTFAFGSDLPQMTADGSGLTGGTTPKVAVSTATDGTTPTRGGLPKTFNGGGVIGSADMFTVYGSYKCSTIGNTLDHAQEQAEANLVAQEESAAESQLWDQIVADSPTTVSSAGDPVTAVALLEGFLADNYGSLGVIHASKAAATALIAAGVVYSDGNDLYTMLGTPVVAGGGYPGTDNTDSTPKSGSEYIAASPSLFGFRSEVFYSSNRPGDLLDRTVNDMYGVAERNYLLGYDPCGVALSAVKIGA